VAAMNPCPCGFEGDPVRACRCTPLQIAKYAGRLSGPLRDRLDLTVDVPSLPPDALGGRPSGEASAAVRARVIGARDRQRLRYAGDGILTNRELTPRLLPMYCALDRGGMRLLEDAVKRLALSARSYDRVRKVARTIADLAGSDRVEAEHLAEALQFRMVERGSGMKA
jgi:magnesium chelatase family protein